MTPRRVNVPSETRGRAGSTAAYILADELLVDPAGRTDDLDRVLRDSPVSHVAVTHHHPDHVGGVAACARAFDLTVWAQAGRTDSFATATGVEPDRTFRPGATIPAGDDRIEVLDTPGHAPEHVGFVGPEGLVSGDIAVAEGSVVVGAPEGDMRAYLTTLRRVSARDPDRLFPAHGPVIDDPRAACDRLLSHRRNRERRVLSAVQADARSVAEILDAAYRKDIGDVRDLARATVVAHLEKLAVEGRVSWDGERARPAQ